MRFIIGMCIVTARICGEKFIAWPTAKSFVYCYDWWRCVASLHFRPVGPRWQCVTLHGHALVLETSSRVIPSQFFFLVREHRIRQFVFMCLCVCTKHKGQLSIVLLKVVRETNTRVLNKTNTKSSSWHSSVPCPSGQNQHYKFIGAALTFVWVSISTADACIGRSFSLHNTLFDYNELLFLSLFLCLLFENTTIINYFTSVAKVRIYTLIGKWS